MAIKVYITRTKIFSHNESKIIKAIKILYRAIITKLLIIKVTNILYKIKITSVSIIKITKTPYCGNNIVI